MTALIGRREFITLLGGAAGWPRYSAWRGLLFVSGGRLLKRKLVAVNAVSVQPCSPLGRVRGGHVINRAKYDPTARSIRRATCADRILALFAAYIFGITALIGVIIAHIRFPDATLLLRSHYQYQIRTFWIGLLYVVVGAVLVTFVPVIGIAILIWWVIWSLVRNVKGLLALNDNKAIQDPASWMFG